MTRFWIRLICLVLFTGQFTLVIFAQLKTDSTIQEKDRDKVKSFAAALVSAGSEEAGAAMLAKDNDKDLVTVELVRELNDHGRRLRDQKDYPSALRISRLSLGLAEQLGDKTGISDAMYSIGYNLHHQGDNTQALEYQQKSLAMRESLGDKTKIAESLNVIGFIYRQQRLFPQALEYYERGLAVSEETRNKQLIAAALVNVGYVQQLVGNYLRALPPFQKSLPLLEETENKAVLASTLFNLGMINFYQGNHASALGYHRKSLKLQDELGNKTQVAYVLNQLSLNHRLLGDHSAALEFASQALTLSETLGNKDLTALTSMSNGLAFASAGNPTRALEFYQKSLASSEESRNKTLIANALEKIGGTHFLQGNVSQALEYYQKSLTLNEEIKDNRQIAFTTISIGEVYRFQGSYSQALDYFYKSLKVSEELGNKFQVANAWNKIGIIHYFQGNYEGALDYFQKGLVLREEINFAGGVIDSVNNIGSIHLLTENYGEALEYYQRSLKLSEKIGSKGGMRDALNNIGEAYLLQGNYAEAMEYSQKSLALSEALGNKLAIPETLTIIGKIYFSQGNYVQALEYTERAATLARQTGYRYSLWNALITSGQAYRSLNHFDKSRQAFEEAILTIESSRASIGGQDARASYFARVQRPYELYVDLLMQMHRQDPNKGHDVLATQMSERSRARTLLEFLTEGRANIRKGTDPELLARERSLQLQLNAREEQSTRLSSDQQTGVQAASLKKEINQLAADYQNVKAQIRRNSPQYAALTQPEPLTVAEIQRDLLDADTVLLEYALGDERSYLWLVTRDSLKSYELPSRSEIEATARRVYELLKNGKRWTQNGKIDIEYEEAAGKLSDMLLGPAAKQIERKRLVVVAEGALQYIPLSALPSPKPIVHGPKSTRFEPLVVNNEIVSLPSASTLAVLRREAAGRKGMTNGVAIIADPVFSQSDERLATAKTPTPKANEPRKTDLSRTALERAFSFNREVNEAFSIPRLPFTRREAESIFAIAPKNSSFKALDFDASRDAVIDLSRYGIIHFATHGILHSEHPELSGIVLSLVNHKGEPVDGFLRLNEIYNMNLNADLVVLSACQTALGKEIRGEGLVGLTRGFMYAGSPRVVASLWKVDDVATAELMKIFYQKMLKEKMRPAAALRAAKIAMYKTKRWNAPYYWAAFELQGEWR